jgi:hypothetical protein
MLKITSVVVALLLSFSVCGSADAAPKAKSFYVAKTGSDKNTGTLKSPFLTLQKCAHVASSGSVCYIRQGSYYETVTPNSGVTFRPFLNDKVEVDGTKTITGFKQYKPNQFVANVTLNSNNSNQVFFGSTLGTEAKWPNGGDEFHPNWATLQAGTSTAVLRDSNLPSDIPGTGLIKFWSGNDAWSAQTAQFNNAGAGTLDFWLDGDHHDQQITPKAGGLYYLFDNLAFLDADFEWFYDQDAGKLYVQIPDGKAITDYRIQAKARDVAFDLRGASHVTIQNLGIFASTIVSDSASHDNVIDGIDAEYISSFTRINDDTYNHPWPGGFDFDHNFDTGIMLNGTHNVLKNSVINHSACNGVLMTGSYNTVSNNLISNVDSLFNNCSGVYFVGDHQSVTHNTIYNTGRSAIFPTGVWHPKFNATSGAPTNSDISYNDLFNTALLGNDIGAIYLGSGVFTGLKIHHNWIHDSHFPNPKPQSIWPLNNISGVYIDENSAGVEVYQNILWNLDFRSIFFNGANRTDHPSDTSIHNNSIPDSGRYAEIRLGGGIANCGTTRVFDNRVLIDVQLEAGSKCPADNNSPTAPGATEMDGVVPGCKLAACAVDPYKPNEWNR